MQQPLIKQGEPEKGKEELFLKQIWDNPAGKIALIAAGILGTALFIGGALKVGTFMMNAYKDFRDANRR